MNHRVRLVLPTVAAAIAQLERMGPKLTPAEKLILPQVIQQLGKQTADLTARNKAAWSLKPHHD